MCRQDAAELELQVRRHREEQERSFEEQSVLALEDRKSSLLRAMTSSDTGEQIKLIQPLIIDYPLKSNLITI